MFPKLSRLKSKESSFVVMLPEPYPLPVKQSHWIGSDTTVIAIKTSVIAFMKAKPGLNNSATLKVIITEQAVVAGIAGGSTQVAGSDLDLVMDGSDSYDPDDDASTSFAYTWACYNASGAMDLCVSATTGSETRAFPETGVKTGPS